MKLSHSIVFATAASILATGAALPAIAVTVNELPEAEQALANTVDPWGLAFNDQLTRFQSRFQQRPDARFCVGITHDLVKILPVKYWFRGRSIASAQDGAVLRAEPLMAAAGTTAAFQIAIIPRMGAQAATYRLSVTLEDPAHKATAESFREVFVYTAKPAYPRLESDRWPDPLVLARDVTVEEGTDLGAFWVDVHLPDDMPGGRITCRTEVTDGVEKAAIVVPIEVVAGLDLKPKRYPFVAWARDRWGGGRLTDEQYRGMCALMLAHHLQPIDALKGRWDPQNPEKFDQFHAFLAEHGQTIFELDSPTSEEFESLYNHVKQAGWLGQCVVYSNADEPDDATFIEKNIPFCLMVHEKYPGLRVYLASEWHKNMAEGCDIWMTDISSSRYHPRPNDQPKAVELWHYYCHLPVRWQMRAPLVWAPNMEIDNQALEHRVALWMSRYYGAQGVFTWAGFSAGDLPADFWTTLRLSDKPSGFPYAGIHNGNNFRVYPPMQEGGEVLPSIRLKVTRAGMEDLALLSAAERLLMEGKIDGERAQKLWRLLDPVPGIFVHPHYFDRLPETLLQRRDEILRTIKAGLTAG